MRIVRALGCLGAVVVSIAVLACGSKNDQQPLAANASASAGYPQQGYPQQGYPQQGYPQQQQGYPPQQGMPQQGAPGAAPVQPTSGQMATPGPLAFPCQNDSGCGLARCNTQFGKCAFPCQSPADCIQGASCNTMTGFCLPGGQ